MSDGHALGDAPLVLNVGSRRAFLKGSGLVTGSIGLLGWPRAARAQQHEPDDCAPVPSPKPPVPFKTDPRQPVRVRKSVSALSAHEVERLREAFAALRQLTESDPADPRGWLRQSYVHCWNCGGGTDQKQGEEIHESWWFFPWHRAYLYFYESILAELVGDPTFALPFWDWYDPKDQTLPASYATPASSQNPLWDDFRMKSTTAKIPPAYVGPTSMRRVMDVRRWQEFMGTPAGTPTSNGGSVENTPHNNIHNWSGDPEHQGEDMGVLATAARDPLFFAHHANVDRLWTVWLRSGGGHANPPYADWFDHRWTFYDERKQLVSISVQDVVDLEESLRYRYEGGTPGAVAPFPRPRLEIAPAAAPVALTPEPLTRSVAVPGDLRERLLGAPEPASRAQRLLLHVDGIVVPGHKGASVRVFANAPEASAASDVESHAFLGVFAVVPKVSSPRLARGHVHAKKNVVLDVTQSLHALGLTAGQLSITLVPTTFLGGKPESVDLTFDAIYLTEAE